MSQDKQDSSSPSSALDAAGGAGGADVDTILRRLVGADDDTILVRLAMKELTGFIHPTSTSQY